MVSSRRTPPPKRMRMTLGLLAGYGTVGATSSISRSGMAGQGPSPCGSGAFALNDSPAAAAPSRADFCRKRRRSSGVDMAGFQAASRDRQRPERSDLREHLLYPVFRVAAEGICEKTEG